MSVNRLDKYYTPNHIAEYTVKKAIEIIGIENITEVVESSAGDGAFIPLIKKYFPDVKHRFYDLYPEHPEIEKQDYKQVRLTYKKGRLTGFNPPFGVSSSLWKAFCKKAAKNSDYIVFISPASQYKSNYYFKEGELVYSELLNDVEYRGSEVEGGKNQKVRTCLNIYKVYERSEVEDWRIGQLEKDLTIGHEIKDTDIRLYRFPFYNPNYKHFSYDYMNKCEWENNKLYEGVKVNNEKLLTKVDELIKNYRTICEKNGEIIGLTHLKHYLIKHLYPTREERLEQDVKIKFIIKFTPESGWYEERNGIREADWRDYEYFITYWGEYAGDVSNTPVSGGSLGVKILNEERRTQIVEALYKVKNEYKKVKGEERSMNITIFKSILVKLFYPTREERLEQDVLFISYGKRFGNITKTSDETPDFYIKSHGSKSGEMTNEQETVNATGVKILNESLRDKIKTFFKNIENKCIKDIDSSMPTLDYRKMKKELIDFLYPADSPEFSDDFDYPEIHKPVHIERDQFAKALF